MNAIQRLGDFLTLPSEITPFEREHVGRINRIALAFGVAHIPVIMGVAAIHGTGTALAFALTALGLVGPIVAMKTLENPRHVAMIFGFSFMCLGGLLVHFGQGPMQIEMHFYFFVVLALLAVYANPGVILLSAATVAVHHLLLYFLLPSSVFNYEASVWVVAVHALFVVLESTAAVFIARNYFDNVIGLEKIIEARTVEIRKQHEQMRLVLDSVSDGLVMMNDEGGLQPQRSAAFDRFLGEVSSGESLVDVVARHDATTGAMLEMGLEELRDGFLPKELLIDQLPSRVEVGERTLGIRYTPIEERESAAYLVAVSDLTPVLERERAEQRQQQMMAMFKRVMSDRRGFVEFFCDAQELVAAVAEGAALERALLARKLHTLKGNAAIFGLSHFAHVVHELESAYEESADTDDPALRARLTESWALVEEDVQALLSSEEESGVHLEDEEYETLLRAAIERRPPEVMEQLLRAWLLEPVERRLQRLGEQASRLASKLGKPAPLVSVEANGLRMDSESWRGFWASMVHVVRNAIDHGVECPIHRESIGKAKQGSLSLRALLDEGEFVVEVQDDGAGVAWDQLVAAARARGVDASEDDVATLLFANGVSTKSEVTDISGRGVGMSAVREEVERRGGTITVTSAPGEGSTFRFRFPSEHTQAVNVYQLAA